MRARIQIETIRCEKCVAKIAGALAPMKGIHEARVELGTSSLVVDYDEAIRAELDRALESAGFAVLSHEPLAAAV